jgi:hypothetical protein
MLKNLQMRCLTKTIWYEEAPLEIKNRLQGADDPLLMLDAFNFSALWTLNGQSWTDPRNTSHIGGITQTLAYLHALKGGFDLAFRWETLGGFGILRWFPAFEELPTYYNYRLLNEIIGLKQGAQLLSTTTTEQAIANLPHHSTQNVAGYKVQPFAVLNKSSDTLSVILINKTPQSQNRAIATVPNQFSLNAVYKYSETRNMQNSLIPLDENIDLAQLPIEPYSILVAQFTKNQTTAIEEDADNQALPIEIRLSNYPNPFNPTTSIVVDLQKARSIELGIYTLMGQKIQTLVKGAFTAGRHRFEFNAANLPSGVYIYKLSTKDGLFTKKMTLLK